MNVLRGLALGGGIVSVFFFSCAGSGGGGGGIGGSGVIRMALTDAPACGYDAVHVTIKTLRVHERADADTGEAGWSDIVLSPPLRVDLLTLQNGALAPLGEAAVTAGHYAQIRMVLAENDVAAPLANAVLPTGRVEAPLDPSSASRSGIKVKLDAAVDPDQVVDVVLDFDACKSVVRAGNSGKYKLKPVVSAIPVGPAGQGVAGFVDPSLTMATTRVSAQQGGVQVKATTPDASGRFMLYPVPVGAYDLVVSAEGRVTAVVTGVPVDALAPTWVNDAASAIAPAPLQAGARAVGGKVLPATGTLRATQRLSAGPTIEAAFAPVDAKSGSYATSLAPDAPWRAKYAASSGPLVFEADTAAAGQYSLQAQVDGRIKTQAVDARQPVPPVNFSFP